MKSRSRSWMREEVILALDVYLAAGLSTEQDRTALSEFLRALPIERHLADEDDAFRNEQSVRNKLYNLQWLDTDGKQGREKGGEVTRAVWEEFGRDAGAVRSAADEIRVAFADIVAAEGTEIDDFEADESAVVIRSHRARERSRQLVARKRAQVQQQTGSLACEACGFDSAVVWGVSGIVECHHLKPVSQLRPGQATRLSDVRLVCPNCHRLIHSRRPWMEWEEVVAIVSDG